MDISIEKIDLIRERTGMSYAEAREVLEEAGGDVVEALVSLEEEGQNGETQGLISQKIFTPVKKVFRQSNRTRISVRNKDGTLLELPVTVGLIGALFAPRITALGAMALLMASYSLESRQAEPVEAEWEH